MNIKDHLLTGLTDWKNDLPIFLSFYYVVGTEHIREQKRTHAFIGACGRDTKQIIPLINVLLQIQRAQNTLLPSVQNKTKPWEHVIFIWSESSKHTEQHIKRLYYNALLMAGQLCRFKEWEEYKYEWSSVIQNKQREIRPDHEEPLQNVLKGFLILQATGSHWRISSKGMKAHWCF